MKTERKFAEVLKNLMSEIPLDDISVSLLAKKCKVNRQTFYYHFHDIYDLLMVVFLNEKIMNLSDAKDFKKLIEKLFQYYLTNKKFIDATLDSAGKDLFEEFIFNNCYQHFMKFLITLDTNKLTTLLERKQIARFYAFSVSNTFIYYLTNHKNKKIEALMENFNFLEEDFLSLAIKETLKNRKKSV